MSSITLRPLTIDDIGVVLPIERELFAGDPPWSAETFRSELTRVPETRWFIAAVAGGRLVGYAGLMHAGHRGEPADIQTIAVAPPYQRSGIGTLLMTELLEEARRRLASAVMLDVRADNSGAIAFYRRFEFIEQGRRRRYFGDGTDGVVMALTLR